MIFYSLKHLKEHLRTYHKYSSLECFYDSCDNGPFGSYTSLEAHLTKTQKKFLYQIKEQFQN